MAAQWIDLYVKAPAGNGYTTPQAMKRVDDHLVQSTPSSFKAPNGLPVQETDGTWEVRVYIESALGLVKSILTQHYGLEIIREIPHN
jgi:hypothetical protein